MAIDEFENLTIDEATPSSLDKRVVHYPTVFDDYDVKKKKKRKKGKKKMRKKARRQKKLRKQRKKKLSKQRKKNLDEQMWRLSWENGYLTAENNYLKEYNKMMHALINVGVAASKGTFDTSIAAALLPVGNGDAQK